MIYVTFYCLAGHNCCTFVCLFVCIVGIFCSHPVNIYGCRLPAIIGSSLMIIGGILSCLSPSLVWMYVLKGIIPGYNSFCCFVTANVAWYSSRLVLMVITSPLQNHMGRAHRHSSWQRMHSSASCATSCTLLTANESNHSAAGMLRPHRSVIRVLYVILRSLIPSLPEKKVPMPIPNCRY